MLTKLNGAVISQYIHIYIESLYYTLKTNTMSDVNYISVKKIHKFLRYSS